MKVIVDSGNPTYYRQRAIELIKEIELSPITRENKTMMAIGLLALAMETERCQNH